MDVSSIKLSIKLDIVLQDYDAIKDWISHMQENSQVYKDAPQPILSKLGKNNSKKERYH